MSNYPLTRNNLKVEWEGCALAFSEVSGLSMVAASICLMLSFYST